MLRAGAKHLRAAMMRLPALSRAPRGTAVQSSLSPPLRLLPSGSPACSWLPNSMAASYEAVGQQRPHQRCLHAARWVAMAQRPADRSQRYGAPARPPAPPQQAPAVPPAPQPPATARPAQPPVPKRPAAPPPQPTPAAQPAPRPSELVPSEDYGMPVRPGAGRMVLVDALPLLYKAHFAFPPDARLHSSSGADTTVVYVFLNMLLNLLGLEPPPTHFAVVFDASGKNFRHELYPDYKGQRPEMPHEIRSAIPLLRDLLQAMGIPVFSIPGVEADDVLGTLAVRGVQEGMVVGLASPDKDFFQLLRMGLILLRPPKKAQYHPAVPAAVPTAVPGSKGGAGGTAAGAAQGAEKKVSKFMLLPYTEADFREEWGLEPPQFVDVLALAGDASDNVPGVAGIGEKTAIALLREFGTVEELLARAGEVPKRAGAALQSPGGAAAARLSKQLVRIETGLDIPPLKLPLAELRLRAPPDGGAAILGMCRQLDFKTQEERLKKLWAGPAYSSSSGGGGSGAA